MTIINCWIWLPLHRTTRSPWSCCWDSQSYCIGIWKFWYAKINI